MTNVDRMNAVYAAFGRGDIAAIVEATSEDVDWGYDGPSKHPSLAWLEVGRGRSKVQEYFRGAGETMEFHSFVPKLVLGQADDVLALCVVDFTVRATGKRVTTTEVMHFTFNRDGRIVRYRPVLDTAERITAYTP